MAKIGQCNDHLTVMYANPARLFGFGRTNNPTSRSQASTLMLCRLAEPDDTKPPLPSLDHLFYPLPPHPRVADLQTLRRLPFGTVLHVYKYLLSLDLRIISFVC